MDGTSKTIVLVEVADHVAVEWTKPEDFAIDTIDPLKQLVGLRESGFLTAFADGSPQFISTKVAPTTVKLLFGRDDRLPLDSERWIRYVPPLPKRAAQ